MYLRRHRRLAAVLLALVLSGAQWLLGRGPGERTLCELTGCPAPEAETAPAPAGR